jgi:hypothetical protein
MLKLLQDKEYNLTRQEMICKVSVICYLLVSKFTEKVRKEIISEGHHEHADKCNIEEINQASLLFHENNFSDKKQHGAWDIIE